MDSIKGKRLVLFSNTFPYGKGETFLADELPFVAAEFESVIIYPLFKAADNCNGGASLGQNAPTYQLPNNVEVETPILNFEDKNRRALLDAGLLDLFPFTWKRGSGFPCKEFWKRALFGCYIPLCAGQRRASLRKRIWIYFNYLCIYRAVRADRKRWDEIVSTCALADIVYFYWGDKSAMIAPVLKKELGEVCTIVPKICARLHGSDLYEGAKGYLPYREEIYGALDLAAVDSEHGCNYIRENYKHQPGEVRACFMGSLKPADTEHMSENSKVLRILSCSNVIELKRVDLIFRSITAILENPQLYSRLKSAGYSKISWTHFGSGDLMEALQEDVNKYFTNSPLKCTIEKQSANAENTRKQIIIENDTLKVYLMGQTPHSEVLKYYSKVGGDLFLLLSRTEGVPISLMEALSYSIPIAATAVGGVPEIFNIDTHLQHTSDEQNTEPANGYNKTVVGYLMDASPRIQDVAAMILDYACLSQNAKAQMHAAALDRWQKRWDGSKNYAEFAALLASLSE